MTRRSMVNQNDSDDGSVIQVSHFDVSSGMQIEGILPSGRGSTRLSRIDARVSSPQGSQVRLRLEVSNGGNQPFSVIATTEALVIPAGDHEAFRIYEGQEMTMPDGGRWRIVFDEIADITPAINVSFYLSHLSRG